MKKTLYTLFTILLVISLTSCGTIRKKIIEKHCKSDSVTIIIHDTIKTESLRVDSVFYYDTDTITIVKDKLTIQYKKVRDSVYLSGTCEGDTLYITKEVKVQTICPSVSSYSFNEWLEGQPFWVGLVVMSILIFAILFAIQTIISAANKYASK